MDIDWQSVVLILGIVGMSLGTVCFTIWRVKQPVKPSLDEQDTAAYPTLKQ